MHETASIWVSPRTGTVYPAGWALHLPGEDLALLFSPSLNDQELDTTPTTRVIYWEGEVIVAGTRRNTPISGLGYVELTGYAKMVDEVASLRRSA
jgi:predicted secreted hydrolase